MRQINQETGKGGTQTGFAQPQSPNAKTCPLRANPRTPNAHSGLCLTGFCRRPLINAILVDL